MVRQSNSFYPNHLTSKMKFSYTYSPLMKSYTAKTGEVERKWLVIDVKGKVLGRVATQIANLLRGKHKPQFTPHTDAGDFVVVINAGEIKLTGNKWREKMYHTHSGYIGGLKSLTATELVKRHPEDLVRLAVKGMLPHNTLSHHLMTKLKIYGGEVHPHQAQKPLTVELRD
jgi:large subunit ribosomal protein L13